MIPDTQKLIADLARALMAAERRAAQLESDLAAARADLAETSAARLCARATLDAMTNGAPPAAAD